MHLLSLAVVLLLAACGASQGDHDTGTVDYLPVMAWDAWEPVDGEDPYAADVPDAVDCTSRAFSFATDGLQKSVHNPQGLVPTFSTSSCDYATVTQPTLRAIEPGEKLLAAVFHTRLLATERAEATISVRVGDQALLDERIAIDVAAPADDCPTAATDGYCHASGRPSGTWTATQTIPAGTPLYFHVHNHGDNEYWLVDLRPDVD